MDYLNNSGNDAELKKILDEIDEVKATIDLFSVLLEEQLFAKV